MVWTLLFSACGPLGSAPETEIEDTDANTDDTDTIDAPCAEWEDGCPLLGDIPLTLAPTRITSHDTQDYFGRDFAIGDFDDDDLPDLALGSATYTDDRAVALFTRLPGHVTTLDADIVLTSPIRAQYHPMSAGDLDGDGVTDLLVGEFGELGSASIAPGPLSDRGLETLDHLSSAQPSGFASSVAACDTDGDGRAEPWVVGVRGAYGFEQTPSGDVTVATADTRILGARGDEFGALACLPAADGRDTVLVSRSNQDPYALGVLRPDTLPLGETTHSDLVLRWTGAFGWSAVMATGPADVALAIGVPDEANGGWNRGSAYVFADEPSGSGNVTTEASAVITSRSDDDRYLGAALAIGDVDGDGFSDLLVTAPGSLSDSHADVGSAYLFYGPLVGALSPSDADARIRADAEELFGGKAQIADLDADGYGDLVFGGLYDAHGDPNGAVYVFRGAPRRGRSDR